MDEIEVFTPPPLPTAPIPPILATSNSIWVSPQYPLGVPLLVSPTDNLMPRTLSCGAAPSMEKFHAYRYREVFQFRQGFRLHPARRQVQGRVRARLGGRARRARKHQREPKALVRARARAERQDVRSRSESGLILVAGAVCRPRVHPGFPAAARRLQNDPSWKEC